MAKTNNDNKKFDRSEYRTITFPYEVDVRFPGDLDYIPAIRKFIAELLEVSNFNPKFAYRSEIIVDEICNNAVTFGCHSDDAEIELISHINTDTIEFTIKDQGCSKENLARLKRAVKVGAAGTNNSSETPHDGIGIEIVRMLSERMDVTIDENNLTSVHIVRNREDERNKQ